MLCMHQIKQFKTEEQDIILQENIPPVTYSDSIDGKGVFDKFSKTLTVIMPDGINSI